ncbi:MAG: DUF3148 domain-containing protein [Leptolyngbyaceae bacterium]|nr:DUF3148 domain-containing protein [Leptolyngbyaceae bacterium]
MVDDPNPTHTESNEKPIELVSTTEQAGLSVGDRVRIVELPPYIKTADPMPMLRPPDVIRLNEEGTILERRSGTAWSVRFDRGVFLMDERFIESVTAADTEP